MVADATDLIEPMVTRDAATTARLHGSELADGFFAQLGPRFLRAYHIAFASSPAGIAFVARDGGAVVGFVIGALDERAHLSWTVRRRGLHLGLAATAALAVRPSLAVVFMRTRARRYVRGTIRFVRDRTSRRPPTAAPASTAEGFAGVLSHVAVEPAHRGNGVGRALIDSFVREAAAGGATRIRTMTQAGEAGASGLYRALGWNHVATRVDLDGTPFEHLDIKP